MNFVIQGAGCERVTDLILDGERRSSIALDGSRPKEPDYKIVATDGEIVAQGSFDYG